MLYWEVYHDAGLRTARIVLTIHNMDNSGECRQDEFGATGVSGMVPPAVLFTVKGRARVPLLTQCAPSCKVLLCGGRPTIVGLAAGLYG